jgi:hypothetical protein
MKGIFETTFQKVRDAEQGSLVGEPVIGLILRYRREQQQSEERCDHQTDENQ